MKIFFWGAMFGSTLVTLVLHNELVRLRNRIDFLKRTLKNAEKDGHVE